MRKFFLNALIVILLVQAFGFASHAVLDPPYMHVPLQIRLISNMIDLIGWAVALALFFGTRAFIKARQ